MTKYVEIISPFDLDTYDDYERRGLLDGVETIVRCRDCKHYYENRPVVSADDHRCRNPMWMNGGLWSIQVSPDGFCAWGERMEP